MLQTASKPILPQRPQLRQRLEPCEVTPAEIVLCRTRPALALLLHLRMTNACGPFALDPASIGEEMAPCPLSPNAVRDALARLIEAGLVEALDACPIPRTRPGRPITRLYTVKPMGAPTE